MRTDASNSGSSVAVIFTVGFFTYLALSEQQVAGSALVALGVMAGALLILVLLAVLLDASRYRRQRHLERLNSPLSIAWLEKSSDRSTPTSFDRWEGKLADDDGLSAEMRRAVQSLNEIQRAARELSAQQAAQLAELTSEMALLQREMTRLIRQSGSRRRRG